MTPETHVESNSTADQIADAAGVSEDKQATQLPRSFVVEASGPATIVRDRGKVTERTDGEISITHHIETLEEFGEFWGLHTKRHPKRQAVNKLLEDLEDDSVAYNRDIDEWDVLIDGHIQAFFGLAETIADYDGNINDFEASSHRYWEQLANNIGDDVDAIVAGFATDLKSCSVWGPGPRLAELTVKHGDRDDLESYTAALLEEVEA